MNAYLEPSSWGIIDGLEIDPTAVGLRQFPKSTQERDLTLNIALRFRNDFKSQIIAACRNSQATDFLEKFLSEDMSTLAWEDGAVLLGFVNAVELRNISEINDMINKVTDSILDLELKGPESLGAKHTDLTKERVSKMLKMIVRDNLKKAENNKFIDVRRATRRKAAKTISFHELKEIYDLVLEESLDDDKVKRYETALEEQIEEEDDPSDDSKVGGDFTDEILDLHMDIKKAVKALEDKGVFPPQPNLDDAYNCFIRKIYRTSDIDDIKEHRKELDIATHEATKLFNELFSQALKLQSWLISLYPTDTSLHESHVVSALDEFNRMNFFQMLHAALDGEELEPQDQYIAQTIAYLAAINNGLKQDPLFLLSSSSRINQGIEAEIDGRFWAHAIGKDVNFIYYRSFDNMRVKRERTPDTPIATHTWASSVNRDLIPHMPDDVDLHIWRNEGSPKTLVSYLLKVLSRADRPENIPDGQRGEAVLSLSKHDLDLNPSKDPERAEKIHLGLEGFVRHHCQSLNLKEADPNTHYTKIPVGTFKIENKARWDSSQGAPKQAFLAVKGYTAVPVDVNGVFIENYDPKIHKNAKVIRREFRVVPYDLSHPAQYATQSTINWEAYKWKMAVELLIKISPRSEYSKVIDIFKRLAQLFDERYLDEKMSIYTQEAA